MNIEHLDVQNLKDLIMMTSISEALYIYSAESNLSIFWCIFGIVKEKRCQGELHTGVIHAGSQSC